MSVDRSADQKLHEGSIYASGRNCDNGDCWCWDEYQARLAAHSSKERSSYALRLDAAEAFGEVFKIADEMDAEIARLQEQLKRYRGIPEHWIGLDGEGGEPYDPAYMRRPAIETVTSSPQLRAIIERCLARIPDGNFCMMIRREIESIPVERDTRPFEQMYYEANRRLVELGGAPVTPSETPAVRAALEAIRDRLRSDPADFETAYRDIQWAYHTANNALSSPVKVTAQRIDYDCPDCGRPVVLGDSICPVTNKQHEPLSAQKASEIDYAEHFGGPVTDGEVEAMQRKLAEKTNEPCMHKWTVLGRIGDPYPEQLCEGGCGRPYAEVMRKAFPTSSPKGECVYCQSINVLNAEGICAACVDSISSPRNE